MHIPKRIPLTVIAIAIAAPLIGKTAPEPYEQTFVLTAYYSPLPGQCCYVKGGLVADKILNGEGLHGADGTAVYPGMLAAPPAYAFGTRVDLPGLGTMTVHDRGGAIQVTEAGVHRLDVWAGYGEEGLARALAFGVKQITGTVYPLGSNQPVEKFDLGVLPAPPDRLRAYLVKGDNLMAMAPKVADTALSVLLLQERLTDLGYLTEAPTGFFGMATQEALGRFITDYQLKEPSDRLTSLTAAHMLAVLQRQAARVPLSENVDQSASKQAIQNAQRLLRGLGYYRGRTNGEYDQKLFSAILQFQQESGLAADMTSPGAGRIGPITMKALHDKWNRSVTAKRAETYLDIKHLDEVLAERGLQIDRFLEVGYSGAAVTQLQNLLADLGFFPADQINGNFGELTKKAVADFQIKRGILLSRSDDSAGLVGPATLTQLQKEQRTKYFRLVRANGWQVF